MIEKPNDQCEVDEDACQCEGVAASEEGIVKEKGDKEDQGQGGEFEHAVGKEFGDDQGQGEGEADAGGKGWDTDEVFVETKEFLGDDNED